VYGLGANAYDTTAVARIFEVKRRPHFDPLIVHLASTTQLNNVVEDIPPSAKILAEHFWPGPLTLVLPRKAQVPDLVTSGLTTVAVRVPNHPLALGLLKKLDFPLACPSANPFGYVSPTTAQHVADQLGQDIDYILDGGSCRIGIESTIVGFENGSPIIYRPGGITKEDLEGIVGMVKTKTSKSLPVAPGMLKHHYAPHKNIIIGNIRDLLEHHGPEQVGILSFNSQFEQVSDHRQIQLSPDGSLIEAAQNLFASLRKLDAMNIKYIFTELVPEHGLGVAINNRLRRAAQ
jgi:L-threonylcarbamoyladenylate synthase